MTPEGRRRLRATVRAAAAALAWLAIVLVPSSSGLRLNMASVAGEPVGTSRDWRLVSGKYWQLTASADDDASAADAQDGAQDGTQGNCPPGMLDVRGRMKLDSSVGTVEELQEESCSVWINRSYPERCALFDADRWHSLSRDLPTRPMHFCVDRFEYPNKKGDNPFIMVTWREATSLCEERGARLCTEDEWTFACEGEEALPFATGYVRDASACVLDRPWRFVHEQALSDRWSAQAQREVDNLWQGEASGAYARCRSPFGAHDMIGNVDEWTRAVRRRGLRSILKGGYWGPVRTQCRASTRVHDEDFYFYQIGFRCCADAPPAPDE